MNMIILWKDSNRILKSHFIATYKSCEWLCIDLTELYPRTYTIQDRGFQLGGEDEGDSGQKILVWARQGLKDENTPLSAESHTYTHQPPVLSYTCVHCRGVFTGLVFLELDNELFEGRDLIILISVSLALIPVK